MVCVGHPLQRREPDLEVELLKGGESGGPVCTHIPTYMHTCAQHDPILCMQYYGTDLTKSYARLQGITN